MELNLYPVFLMVLGSTTSVIGNADHYNGRTATQPQRNRKFCQFNNDQYCKCIDGRVHVAAQNTPEQRIVVEAARPVIPGVTRIVEVFVWTGPDVFRFHKQRLTLSSKETSEFLRIWEKALIRDVDLIFLQIKKIDIRLYYVGGGGDSSLQESWYSDNTNNRVPFMDAINAQVDVKAFLEGNPDVPPYDHAIVLTRKDLALDISGTRSDIIAYGSPEIPCSTPTVSIAEVWIPRFMKALAQSILLSFSLPYDNTQQYRVMSEEYSVMIPLANSGDRWQLSNNSQIELGILLDGNDACFLTQGASFNYTDFVSTPNYGATYDVDAQCSNIYGSSASCQLQQARICYDKQSCVDPTSGDCSLEILFGDKTSCSNTNVDEMCRYGNCTDFGAITITTTTTVSPPTTTAPCNGECVCELYPLGTVNARSEYIPCP